MPIAVKIMFCHSTLILCKLYAYKVRQLPSLNSFFASSDLSFAGNRCKQFEPRSGPTESLF